MKSLLLSAVFVGVVAYVRATCQQDLDTCKATYEHALPNIGDATVLCNVGNTYINCLRDLANRNDCSGQVARINEYRRKAQEQLNANATKCMQCASEEEACQTTWKNSASHAGQNITVECKDDEIMVLCLVNISKKAECAPEKAHIEHQRRKVEETLNLKGCDTGRKCTDGIRSCDPKESGSASTAAAVNCKAITTQYACLSNQPCTGEFAKALKLSMDVLVELGRAGNCTMTDSGAEGMKQTATVLGSLLLVVFALWK